MEARRDRNMAPARLACRGPRFRKPPTPILERLTRLTFASGITCCSDVSSQEAAISLPTTMLRLRACPLRQSDSFAIFFLYRAGHFEVHR